MITLYKFPLIILRHVRKFPDIHTHTQTDTAIQHMYKYTEECFIFLLVICYHLCSIPGCILISVTDCSLLQPQKLFKNKSEQVHFFNFQMQMCIKMQYTLLPQ